MRIDLALLFLYFLAVWLSYLREWYGHLSFHNQPRRTRMTITQKPDVEQVVETPVVIGPVEKVLRDALARLNEGQGWCKGLYANGRGERCSIGAVYGLAYDGSSVIAGINIRTVLPPKEYREAEEILRRAACDLTGHLFSVASYNDDPRTTWADIKAMFTKAIDRAHEEGI